jgi:hypothetical protein
MIREEGCEGHQAGKKKDRHKEGQGDPPVFARIDPFQRDPGRFAQMVQIKKDEKPLRAQERNGDKTKKEIRVRNGIKCKAYHRG